MEFPRFNGGKVESWKFRYQQFFECDEILEESKIKIVSANLEDKALYWHQSYMKGKFLEGVYPQWIDYAMDITTWFNDHAYERPYANLKNLYQKGSLREYVEAYYRLYDKVELYEEVATEMFVWGLKDEIHNMVLLLQPRNLKEANAMARIQEDNYQSMSSSILSGKSFTAMGSRSFSHYEQRPNGARPMATTA